MQINCKICGSVIEIPDEMQDQLQDGQHILCPCCGKKFTYSSSSQNNIRQCRERAGIPNNMPNPHNAAKKKLLTVGGVTLFILAVLAGVTFWLFVGESDSKKAGLELDCRRVNARECPIGQEGDVESVLTSAEAGSAYFYTKGNLVVRQVIPHYGILVSSRSIASPAILIRTDRTYIDGVELRPGLYACIGTARYPNKDGFVQTVLAFEEAEPSVAQSRAAELARQKAEEELKRQKLAEEARIEREKTARAEREAAEAARVESAKIKAATEVKLAQLRQEEAAEKERRRIEAEKEAKEAKAKADAAAAEEAKKRYPVEQKMRAEYAASKLSAISFNLKDYFIIEKALLPMLKSSSVTEDAWRQMKSASGKKDWLGILSVAAGEQLKDYPDTHEIDALIATIVEREYHAEFDWSCDSVTKTSISKGVFSASHGLDFVNLSYSCDIIEFVPSSRKGKILLFRHFSDCEIACARKKYCDACANYQSAVILGRITQATADEKKKDAFENCKKRILSSMSHSGFKARSSANDLGGSHDDLVDDDYRETRRVMPVKKKREIDPRLKTFQRR